jgi:DNA-binding transcriptional MerR regulator
MKSYTVKQLAKLAQISVKTLHHYDEISLLKPAKRSNKDYRLYTETELFRLQQILLYKELEIPLTEIKTILDDPGFDLSTALEEHKLKLSQKQERYGELIHTIEKTLQYIQENEELVTDNELYAGFTSEKKERYNRVEKEKYGDEYDLSQKNIRKLNKGQWSKIQEESKKISEELSKCIGTDPNSSEVQALIKKHHSWIENFYPCPKKRYIGLSDLYIESAEFKQYYEDIEPGLAEYLSLSMKIFAKTL